MLKDRSRFCLFNSFRHHIENIVHNRSAKLKIEVRLDSLFRDRLCDTFRVTTFELSNRRPIGGQIRRITIESVSDVVRLSTKLSVRRTSVDSPDSI
jgi:hypothetical protein